jgi:hypothetical protein
MKEIRKEKVFNTGFSYRLVLLSGFIYSKQSLQVAKADSKTLGVL